LPDGVTLDQRRNLIEDKRRDIHLNVWPNTSLPMLDGKRPLDVASDPAYRVRLLAAILVLDLAGEQSQSTFDYNELRAKLGLPIRSDIALDGKTVADISLVRLHLLPPEQLSDEDLANAYIRAAMHRASRAIRRLAPDVVKRPNLKSKVDFGEVYYTLSQVAHNLDEAVEFNKHAQEAAIAGGKSPARWLLQELDLRMMRGEPQECDRVVRRLETRHGREPGVMEALYAWLVRIGVITPDGRPAAGLAARRPEAAAVTAGAEPAGPAAGLWTPDRPSPPPTDQGKPGLWLPGMD
jgi:hypothetical protein